MRTYRVEKLIYGALEATLGSYRFGKATSEIPIMRMISMTSRELRKRAQNFSRRLRSQISEAVRTQLLNGNSVIGGGSCPECQLPTTLVALESDTVRPNTIESRLRCQDPPIILRLEEDKALIDLRTVFPSQESMLIEGLKKAVC